MFGAKLPFLIYDISEFYTERTFIWNGNGKTILCGLVGGYFGVELMKWAKDIKIKTGDSFAVPVAVGIAIGRWGCFLWEVVAMVHLLTYLGEFLSLQQKELTAIRPKFTKACFTLRLQPLCFSVFVRNGFRDS